MSHRRQDLVARPGRPAPGGTLGITRRQWLRSAGLVAGTPLALRAGPRRRSTAATRRLVVSETAGLRRFGYPVHVLLPPAGEADRFRLLRGGQPVPAQFRRLAGEPGGVALDFVASPAPFEVQEYEIARGPDVEPGPEPGRGLGLERTDDAFHVDNRPSLRFTFPGDGRGFLRSVDHEGRPFLDPDSPGLWFVGRDGRGHRVGGADGPGRVREVRVRREGPLAVAIRYDVAVGLEGGPPVASAVEVAVPSTKSWVEAAWTLDDPRGLVAGVGLDLDLKVEGRPTLVDFGARSTVYGTLEDDGRMRLQAGDPERPGWRVHKGRADQLEPFAESDPSRPEPAEGWAHVMDRDRATALAVDGFGRGALDALELAADGRVRLSRRFLGPGGAIAAGRKTWRFWLHFVPMPVQLGAATSPQAMQAPLGLELGGEVAT